MDNQISEILIKIDSLSELIKSTQENVNFNIGLTWTMLGAGIALAAITISLITKALVNTRVEKELKVIKENINNEVYEFKSGLDQRIIELIDNRSKIRWASGQIVENTNNQISIHGLSGVIDWESPITSVRVRDVVNKTEVPFELLEKRESSFSFKVTDRIAVRNLEWIIVWYEKN